MSVLNTVKGFITKNSTKILLTLGIFGYGYSCYSFAKSYETCKKRINLRKAELEVEKLPVKEVVKTCWKPMALPTLSFVTSSVCVFEAHNILLKKNTGLVAAVKTSEIALSEFKKETKKAVGDEVYKQIQDKAAENQMQREEAPMKFNKKEYYDDARDLWFDGTYGGYFRATEVEISKAFEEVRNDITYCNRVSLGKDYHEYVPLQNIYYALHGDPISIGDDFGYDIKEYSPEFGGVKFDYTISDTYKLAPNGERALVLFYDRAEPIT